MSRHEVVGNCLWRDFPKVKYASSEASRDSVGTRGEIANAGVSPSRRSLHHVAAGLAKPCNAACSEVVKGLRATSGRIVCADDSLQVSPPPSVKPSLATASSGLQPASARQSPTG